MKTLPLKETKIILKRLEELRNMSKNDTVQTWPSPELDFDYTEQMGEIKGKERERHFIQYSIEQGQNYRPAARTTKILPPGLYKANRDQYGIFYQKQEIDMSELIRFEGTIADTIIGEFNEFWGKKSLYEDRGETHKRGFMLWGPPGGGKTSTVSFIMKDFINSGGIVFDFTDVLIDGIRQLKIVEPDRKVMIVMEDIDAYLHDYGNEQAILDMLDGSVKHSNTILIATTNYPERLPDRIINRPSRFDRVEYIGTPSKNDRKIYLKEKSKTLSTKDINKWVKDTNGWTLAHIKELILSVEVFGLGYVETLDRLNKMRKKLESSGDYERELRGKEDTNFGFRR